MNLMARLKYLRKNAGMSQKELGEKVGVSLATISKYEVGDVTPPYDKIIALAEIFDVSADYLLGLTDDPRRANGEEAKEDFICIMGSNGKREKIRIPPDKAERVKKLLESAFPELMDDTDL